MARNIKDAAVVPITEGMVNWLKKNLVANTVLVSDAAVGATTIYVDDTMRFDKFDSIVIMDDNAAFDATTQAYTGIEFHTIAEQPDDPHELVLDEPLQKGFAVANHGRIQKAIAKTILYEKDILYGDRNVIGADFVAVCVEPESKATEWLAIEGLLGIEWRMAIMVYVKAGGISLNVDEQFPATICHNYADAIEAMLNNDLHIDLCIDETPLRANACAGDTTVYIGSHAAPDWGVDPCCTYRVQDTNGASEFFQIVALHSSSSSDSTCPSCGFSTSSVRSSMTSLGSSLSSKSSKSSRSSRSSSSSSIQSASSQTSATVSSASSTSSSTSSTESSVSSSSSAGGTPYPVNISWPLNRNFRMADKAVLMRYKRYMYDSRVDRIEYGTVQKGSAVLKAARLSWFAKETDAKVFPQIGRG